jgi:hypothetical protein
VGKFPSSIGQIMETGGLQFKDESGNNLDPEFNQAIGRSADAAISRKPMREDDATLIKSRLRDRSAGRTESSVDATKRAARTAPNQPRRTIGGAGRVERPTLVGEGA